MKAFIETVMTHNLCLYNSCDYFRTLEMSFVGPLLVFDFDHTITDLNTDVEVQKLAPGGEIPASSEMRGLYSDKGWTEFMGAVFALLHENNTTQAEILSLMAELEFTPNMSSLLEESVNSNSAIKDNISAWV